MENQRESTLETVTRSLTMLVINNRTNQDYIRLTTLSTLTPAWATFAVADAPSTATPALRTFASASSSPASVLA
jgi:hypothetical protein